MIKSRGRGLVASQRPKIALQSRFPRRGQAPTLEGSTPGAVLVSVPAPGSARSARGWASGRRPAGENQSCIGGQRFDGFSPRAYFSTGKPLMRRLRDSCRARRLLHSTGQPAPRRNYRGAFPLPPAASPSAASYRDGNHGPAYEGAVI